MTDHPPSLAHRETVGRTPEERPRIPPRHVVQEYLTLCRAALEGAGPVVPRPPREGREQKATRLIADGCVIVLALEPETRAVVHSNGQRYRVGWGPGGWSCSCINPSPTCSHIAATKRMTTARHHTRPTTERSTTP